MTLTTIPLESITERIDARAIHPHGVTALTKKMQLLGFLPQFPILVSTKPDGTYRLLDGAHRVEAAGKAGLTQASALVREPCTDLLEEIALARASNEASGTNVQTTLVDNAELVWRLIDAGYTTAQIGKALGQEWGESKAKHHSALRQIDSNAWEIIVTTFEGSISSTIEESGTHTVPNGTPIFTEGLLRDILGLTPSQQLELCTGLANGALKKGGLAGFIATAKNYKARNAAAAWVQSQLGTMEDDWLSEALRAVATGQYDDEWQKHDGPGIKLNKLIESIRDRWEKKHAIRLLHGDFYQLIKDIGDASIDAIIVDPPYNISTDRVYTLATQADWNKNFGEWDNLSDADFCRNLTTWAHEYFRILKPGTTGFMFVGEPYLNMAQALFHEAGFEIKGTFYWCRTNPGPSVTKADFMPAIDMAIQFVKPGAPRTFHYPGDEEGVGFNWRRFPLCSGHERLLNAKKETLHPTQKPEAVIQHLMGLITVPGDMVFDGFMGTGTTAKVAKVTGRKFLGFEQDPSYFEAAQRRVEG